MTLKRKNVIFVKKYEIWCVEAAQEKWKLQYLNFEYVIKNLMQQNKQFYNFGRISPADRKMIYRLIYKW